MTDGYCTNPDIYIVQLASVLMAVCIFKRPTQLCGCLSMSGPYFHCFPFLDNEDGGAL